MWRILEGKDGYSGEQPIQEWTIGKPAGILSYSRLACQIESEILLGGCSGSEGEDVV